MRRNIFALLRTFLFAALLPVVSLGLVSCEPESEDDNTTPGTSSYKAVDLGLSVKWASCNVGAKSPEDYGTYFAWGETAAKSSYTTDNSLTADLSLSALRSRGIIDFIGNLTPAYDAATANWGGSWRMPTSAEIYELRNDCTWRWTTQNGVYGCKVTGPNGNSIFLPATGYCTGSGSAIYTERRGDYSSADYSGGGLEFVGRYSSLESIKSVDFYRHVGITVRPVTE